MEKRASSSDEPIRFSQRARRFTEGMDSLCVDSVPSVREILGCFLEF